MAIILAARWMASSLDCLRPPKTWHVLEFKTHGTKSFADLTAKGVLVSKPQHGAQMQIYMHLTGITRALYMAVCKNTDALHIERVEADPAMAERLLDKAGRGHLRPASTGADQRRLGLVRMPVL